MLKKIIIHILIPILLIQIFGCFSEQLIDKENLKNNTNNKIRIVASYRKEYISEQSYWNTRNDTLFIKTKDSTRNEAAQKIPFSSIKLAYAEQFDTPGTILLGIGILFVVVILYGLINSFQSFPFGRTK